MPFFKCDDICAWTGGAWHNLNPDKKPEIRGFSIDSRKMSADFAFVALKGERDGHDFAKDAVAKGATAVIAERELEVGAPVLVVEDSLKAFQSIAKFHRLRFENPVVAISGSCGKTSTKEMLAALCAWKNPLVTEKNFNNEIGVPLTLTRIDLRQNQLAIIEAGVSGPNQMQSLAEMIEPDISIITNAGLTHLEAFKEIANVAKEKAILPMNSAEGGWCLMHRNMLSWKAFDELKCKKAVAAPADAPEFKADLIFRYTFADSSQAGYVGLDICVEGGDEFYFEIPEMTPGMLENAVLAIAASLMLGAREEYLALKTGLLGPLPMRGTVVEGEKSKFYVDCYNASPTSMKDAIGYFQKISKDAQKRLYILGSMAELGLATHRHHREIGSHLARSDGDKVYVVGPSAEIYKAGLLEGGWSESDISVFDNAEDAREAVQNFEGFIFVKGSRSCELEKLLPEGVREKLSAAPEAIEPAEAEFAETNNAEDAGNGGADDAILQEAEEEDGDECAEEFEDFDDDSDMDASAEDEDEREKI